MLTEYEKKIIEQVKNSFTSVYTKGNNDTEVKKLIDMLQLKDHGSYLDLGTGNGYVAFMIEKQKSGVFIDGIDIVDSMIERNNHIANTTKKSNIHFIVYDGVNFPIPKKKYDGVIARFSLHHFPSIEKTIGEMNRVLKQSSRIIISDCIRKENDQERFIDKWMRLHGDGHVSFVDSEKYEIMLGQKGFVLKKKYITEIKVPREINSQYLRLLEQNISVAQEYCCTMENKTIWLQVPVANLCFERL